MLQIAIIGTTKWGTALSLMLAQKGLEFRLWARTAREAAKLRKNGPNQSQGITFPPQLVITSHIGEALADVKAVIMAVPSQTMRQNMSLVASHLSKSMAIVSAAKGLEIGSGKSMSQVIAEEIDANLRSTICVLSRPT